MSCSTAERLQERAEEHARSLARICGSLNLASLGLGFAIQPVVRGRRWELTVSLRSAVGMQLREPGVPFFLVNQMFAQEELEALPLEHVVARVRFMAEEFVRQILFAAPATEQRSVRVLPAELEP